jgi:hypothetical protein
MSVWSDKMVPREFQQNSSACGRVQATKETVGICETNTTGIQSSVKELNV